MFAARSPLAPRRSPALRGCARALAFILLGAVAVPAGATTIVRLGLDRMVGAADTIVEGRVERVRSYWQDRQIVTEVTIRVSRSLKGSIGPRIAFVQIGGSVSEPVPVTMTVPGAPVHSVGDEAFYFLEPGAPGQRIIVGLNEGRVPVGNDDRGAFVRFEGRRLTPGEFADEIRRVLAAQAPAAAPGANR